jgi:hypothetical protein
MEYLAVVVMGLYSIPSLLLNISLGKIIKNL